MRVKNSIKNIYYSMLIQVCMTLLGFISRRVFINNLDIEYLGINGLLTNVLSMLSLVEGGIGASIIYNMYKPLAEDDKPAIIALVQLYKKKIAKSHEICRIFIIYAFFSILFYIII